MESFIRLGDGEQMAVVVEYQGQERVVVLWAMGGHLMAVQATGEEEVGWC